MFASHLWYMHLSGLLYDSRRTSAAMTMNVAGVEWPGEMHNGAHTFTIRSHFYQKNRHIYCMSAFNFNEFHPRNNE